MARSKKTRSGYDAFISYSHALDGSLAPALQAGLEAFGRRAFRIRASRVFCDDANLAASPDLWNSIVDAMRASTWFIMLASPEAARSPWVTREIEWWLDNRGPSNLIVGLTSGDISWTSDGPLPTDALPEPFFSHNIREPRWVDLRNLRSIECRDPAFQLAIAEIAAPIRDVPKDELIGEHVRQGRRRRRWITSFVSLLAVLMTVSVVQPQLPSLNKV